MIRVLYLKGEERVEVGKGAARATRRSNLVPAVIYGGGKSQVMLSLPEKELTLEYNKSGFMSHVFDLHIGNHKYRVVPKHIQLHPVTDRIIHADFIHVSEHSRITVLLPLHFLNKDKCPGVKHGGLVNIVKHELEVSCLVDAIPESIEFDIAHLEIGDSVHVKDLELPQGVSVQDADITVLTVVAARTSSDDKSEGSAN